MQSIDGSSNRSRFYFAELSCFALLVTLGACGGGSDSGGSIASAANASLVKAAVACTQMTGKTIPAASIGMSTTGAKLTSATLIPSSGTGTQAIGGYCLIDGTISPVDPAAPNIEFHIAMPTSWNKKIMMFGGGGYDGSIPDVTANVPSGPSTQATPLARGYTTFASDSGHEGTGLAIEDGSFGVNDEALNNFTGDALKKTHDVAVYVVDSYYGVSAPSRAYFAGGSSGGREALEVVQRWPADWDGIIALYPAWASSSLDLQFGRITRALAAPGAYLDEAKRKVLLDTVMAVCDSLDGVTDGLISNVKACNAQFNPRTAKLNGTSLRCPGGSDTGDTCLSDAQIAALDTYNTPITFNFKLKSGETQYPGFNVYGSDLGIVKASASQPFVLLLALDLSQPSEPMPSTAPFMSIFWDQWTRYFVTRNSSYNSFTVDPQNPGVWADRISELSALQDVNNVDLTAFNKRGGKILMAHGMADVLVSTRSTEQYYQRLQDKMGSSTVKNFVRFYEIPGFGHAYSSIFNPAWDSLSTLEKWVESGTAPPLQIITDTEGVPGRTRPLCEYPTFPRYNGSGNVNAASSFTCAAY